MIVRACPLNLEKENIVSLITEIAGSLLKNKRDILPEKLDWIYHSIACRAAIKAGNDNSDYEPVSYTHLFSFTHDTSSRISFSFVAKGFSRSISYPFFSRGIDVSTCCSSIVPLLSLIHILSASAEPKQTDILRIIYTITPVLTDI